MLRKKATNKPVGAMIQKMEKILKVFYWRQLAGNWIGKAVFVWQNNLRIFYPRVQ
jgi:hypothetical protein